MAAPQKREPNKYAKNADIKADTPLKTIGSAVGMLLMLLGIAGIGLDFFKEGGWVKTAFAWLFESTTRMMFIPVIIFALWLMNRMMSSTNPDESKKSGNIPMYAMMGVGLYYIYRFISTGAL
jgi:hypothetical protein